jgi:sensor histidine kinase regulating citrate/malate metabolism
VHDEIHLTDDRVLVVNKSLIAAHGSVITLRDHTDLQALTGELDSVKGFAESLRSQAHEAANRLHTVVSLIELDRTTEAVRFATEELEIAQRLTDRVVDAVNEPVLAALLLGKMAEASQRGVELVITPDTQLDELGAGLRARDLVTILGNLIDNAMDAAADGTGPPKVFVTAKATPAGLLLRVADTGSGLESEAAFTRGWSTKNGSRGLGLALVGQTVRRYGGSIEIGREVGAVFTVRLP